MTEPEDRICVANCGLPGDECACYRQMMRPAAVTVKPLEWVDNEVGTLTSKDFKIYRLDHPRREVWRLVQADFGNTYRGDFGGNDGKEQAMEVAATIDARRVISSVNVTPAPVAQPNAVQEAVLLKRVAAHLALNAHINGETSDRVAAHNVGVDSAIAEILKLARGEAALRALKGDE
jgi:hypothetical protein